MQNVLLIGDSIRLFYQDEVKNMLGDTYTVYGPEENCRFSAYVFNSLRLWFKEFPIPDIIHWNAGLWDTAILYPEDGCFTPLDEYIKNMGRILRELKKTGAKLVFSTTTPVSDEKSDFPGPMPPAHRNTDIINYNNAVLEIFKNEDIIINDLHSIMYPDRHLLLLDDMIHPNDTGVKLLGQAVADAIKKCGYYQNHKKTDSALTSSLLCEKTIQ